MKVTQDTIGSSLITTASTTRICIGFKNLSAAAKRDGPNDRRLDAIPRNIEGQHHECKKP